MLFFGCMALLVAGCNKVETVEAPVKESSDHLIVDIRVNQEGGTRSIKQGWEAGDVIYVVFDHYFSADPDLGTSYSYDVLYMTLTYNGCAWHSDFSDSALETYLSGQTSGTLMALFFTDLVPQFRVMHAVRGNQEGYLINIKNSVNQLGFYLYDQNCSYTVQDGVLSASLNMHPHENAVHFFVPGITHDPQNEFRYTFQSEFFRLNEVSSIVSTNTNNAGFVPAELTIEGGAYSNASLIPTYRPDGVAYSARLTSSSNKDKEVEYVIKIIDRKVPSTDRDDISYTLTKTATLHGGDAIVLPPLSSPRWERAYVTPYSDKGFIDNHEYVRMADGRRWSTLNVGAADETDPGDFLIWTNARDKAQAWGDNWSLPTKEMWDELLTNSNHEVTPVYETVNGQQVFTGLKVKALTDVTLNGFYYMSGGNELFLPTAGYKTKPNSSFIQYGSPNGYYWTFSTYWQGTDPRVNYVTLTPGTPYVSSSNMTIDAVTYMLARPVYNK